MRTQSAVSELVGALLLTAIITAVVLIVSVNILSQPLPVEHPATEFDLTYICNENSQDNIIINHGRGDAFKVFGPVTINDSKSVINIKINGDPWDVSNETGNNQFKLIKYNTTDTRDNYFSIGDQLVSNWTRGDNLPIIQFIDRNPNGAEYQLWEKKVNAGSTCTVSKCPAYVGKPTACYVPSDQIVNISDIISFDPSCSQSNDNSYPIIKYIWDFGDGTTLVMTDPVIVTHSYNAYGTYPVKLTVKNKCGNFDEYQVNIIVSTGTCDSSVTANFITNPSPPTQIGGTSFSVSFTDTSTSVNSSIISRLWNFGDGTTSTAENPAHTYSYGSYYARLTVTDSCGRSSTKVVLVSLLNDSDCYVSPMISVNPGTSGYEPFTVTLTDSSTTSLGTINSWLWDFGDGNTSTSQGPFTRIYSNGTYIINLTVTNSCGATSSTTETIVVSSGYIITASAGSGGTISPSGNVIVVKGTDQPFNIVSSPCYFIQDVLVDGISQGAITSYLFTNVQSNHEIYAIFSPAYYYITSSAGLNGIITPSGVTNVSCGGSQTYTITPADTCHTIADVLIDGSSVGAVGSYTFQDIQANHTISATFIPISYNITASAGTGGTVSPSGSTSVNCNESLTYTITPDHCYLIDDIKVDGSSVGAVDSYTFTNVTGNHTISAAFSPISYYITASAGTGGIVSPSGNLSINCGVNKIYTITPDPCYKIADVLVDGVSQGAITTYTFTNVQADHTISATFSLKSYNITASAGSNGSITPLGNTSVGCGGSQTYTITPDSCYGVSSVLVDGVSQGAVTTYTFTNVQAGHTISATFSLKTYNITASAGSNGSITPPGNTSVGCGGSQTYTITPDSCYKVSSVLVDGISQGTITSYTFTNVQADHTISATFSLKTYNITASAGSNGSITPSGITSVSCGGSQTYTITPNSCYKVASVLVDGVSQGAITTYTFTNVQADHTISATFTPATYIINATAGTGGSISPSGLIVVTCGNSQTFTITPNSGYVIDDVVVDGSSMGIISSYTFTNVQADHTIVAAFAQTTNVCAISGYITNATTGIGVSGIRVDIWDQSRTTILRSGVSQSNGYYAINHPRPSSAYKVDINCPDQGTWYTTSPTSPLRGWYDDIVLNPGGFCDVENKNFAGYNISSGSGDFLWNSGSKPGHINAGGEFSFVVAAPVSVNAYIDINSVRNWLAVGDLIRIYLPLSQSTGDVFYSSHSGTNQQLTTLAFSNVILYKNGVQIATGACTGVNIPNMTSISSTLTLTIPSGVNAWTNFVWDGKTIINGNDDKGIVIFNITPSYGTVGGGNQVMQLNIDGGYYRGRGSGFVLA